LQKKKREEASNFFRDWRKKALSFSGKKRSSIFPPEREGKDVVFFEEDRT